MHAPCPRTVRRAASLAAATLLCTAALAGAQTPTSTTIPFVDPATFASPASAGARSAAQQRHGVAAELQKAAQIESLRESLEAHDPRDRGATPGALPTGRRRTIVWGVSDEVSHAPLHLPGTLPGNAGIDDLPPPPQLGAGMRADPLDARSLPGAAPLPPIPGAPASTAAPSALRSVRPVPVREGAPTSTLAVEPEPAAEPTCRFVPGAGWSEGCGLPGDGASRARPERSSTPGPRLMRRDR